MWFHLWNVQTRQIQRQKLDQRSSGALVRGKWGVTAARCRVYFSGGNCSKVNRSDSCFCCSVAQSSLTLFCDPMDYGTLPCPSPSPGLCSNSCPLSRWCHPTISSSVVPVSSCLQSFPVSGSSQMSQFFSSGSQSIGASASASVLPMNIQGWFPLGWTGLILQSKGLSRVFSSTTVWKHQFFSAQPS